MGGEPGDPKNDTSDFESAPIVGRTALTVEDFTRVWGVLPHTRNAVVRLALVVLAIPAFAGISALLNTQATGAAGQINWLYAPVPVVLAAALAFGVWRGRKRWAENAVLDLRGGEGVEFRFEAGGFSVDSPGRQAHLAWDSLHRCLETADAFVIYTGPAMVVVVPKRAFAAADQLRLRAQLLALVPEAGAEGHAGTRPRRIALDCTDALILCVVARAPTKPAEANASHLAPGRPH